MQAAEAGGMRTAAQSWPATLTGEHVTAAEVAAPATQTQATAAKINLEDVEEKTDGRDARADKAAVVARPEAVAAKAEVAAALQRLKQERERSEQAAQAALAKVATRSVCLSMRWRAPEPEPDSWLAASLSPSI